jgi:hypothetical protein
VAVGSTIVALVVLLLATLAPPAAAQDDDDAPSVPADRRVLVISVPGLTWEDVNEEDVPTLRALLDESAIANVSLRVERMATPAGEGYATLSAGTRAIAPVQLAGMGFGPMESFGSGSAADELGRQLGYPPPGEVLHLAWHDLKRRNEASDFEAELGTLGDALADAGVTRGVIGNADGDDPFVFESLHREAALALADTRGIIPCGDVTGAIVADEPTAPYGVQLDHDRVLETARRCLTPASVVLVEASDVRRADTYGPRVSNEREASLRSEALKRTDALVAQLLEEVDLARDAVVVLAPSVSSGARLTVVGIHAEEYPAGLLVSGGTRQNGFVLLSDLTPTIAALAGATIDEGAIEGRQVEVGATDGTGAERRERLEEADAAARFRDRMITPVAAAFITGIALLALASIALLRGDRRSRAIEHLSLILLAVPPMTYLVAPLPFHEWGAAAYFATVGGGAAVLGVAFAELRRWWLRPLAASYVLMFGVIAVSVVLLRSRLQLSTVFGDSPIVAGRFSGVNNVTFAQIFVSAVALAAIVAERIPGRRGRIMIVGILVAAVLVDAAPMWGADVGGALAAVPAFALVGARLCGWRIRWRTLLVWGAIGVVVVLALGFLDLQRDAADRTHFGRLLERIESQGLEGFTTVIERKATVNLRSLSGSVWRYALVPVILGAVLLVWRAPGRVREVLAAFPSLRKVSSGVAVGLVLGYAVNDSGIAVPGMMVAVMVPAATYLVSRVAALRPAEPTVEDDPGDEPDHDLAPTGVST